MKAILTRVADTATQNDGNILKLLKKGVKVNSRGDEELSVSYFKKRILDYVPNVTNTEIDMLIFTYQCSHGISYKKFCKDVYEVKDPEEIQLSA